MMSRDVPARGRDHPKAACSRVQMRSSVAKCHGAWSSMSSVATDAAPTASKRVTRRGACACMLGLISPISSGRVRRAILGTAVVLHSSRPPTNHSLAPTEPLRPSPGRSVPPAAARQPRPPPSSSSTPILRSGARARHKTPRQRRNVARATSCQSRRLLRSSQQERAHGLALLRRHRGRADERPALRRGGHRHSVVGQAPHGDASTASRMHSHAQRGVLARLRRTRPEAPGQTRKRQLQPQSTTPVRLAEAGAAVHDHCLHRARGRAQASCEPRARAPGCQTAPPDLEQVQRIAGPRRRRCSDARLQ